MRALWKLVRYFVAVLGYTTHLWWTVRRLPEAERDAYRAARQSAGSRAFCRILNIRVHVEGAIPEDGHGLVIANHLSFYDPFMLASQLPIVFAGKSELKDWPVVGWVCRTVGLIFVQRERRMQTTAFVDQVRAKLDHGVRVLVFPEGTTGNGNGLRPFKTGGFQAIARTDAYDVLPIYLHLTRLNDAPVTEATRQQFTWTTGTFVEHVWTFLSLRSADVTLHVGTPIPVADQDRKALAKSAQAAVEQLALQPLGVDAK